MDRTLTTADLLLMAGTRVALGIGIGMLVSGRLTRDARKAAGLSLLIVGALTTIPIAVNIMQRKPVLVERSAA